MRLLLYEKQRISVVVCDLASTVKAFLHLCTCWEPNQNHIYHWSELSQAYWMILSCLSTTPFDSGDSPVLIETPDF